MFVDNYNEVFGQSILEIFTAEYKPRHNGHDSQANKHVL